jgi:hypothetical protein
METMQPLLTQGILEPATDLHTVESVMFHTFQLVQAVQQRHHRLGRHTTLVDSLQRSPFNVGKDRSSKVAPIVQHTAAATSADDRRMSHADTADQQASSATAVAETVSSDMLAGYAAAQAVLDAATRVLAQPERQHELEELLLRDASGVGHHGCASQSRGEDAAHLRVICMLMSTNAGQASERAVLWRQTLPALQRQLLVCECHFPVGTVRWVNLHLHCFALQRNNYAVVRITLSHAYTLSPNQTHAGSAC